MPAKIIKNKIEISNSGDNLGTERCGATAVFKLVHNFFLEVPSVWWLIHFVNSTKNGIISVYQTNNNNQQEFTVECISSLICKWK